MQAREIQTDKFVTPDQLTQNEIIGKYAFNSRPKWYTRENYDWQKNGALKQKKI